VCDDEMEVIGWFESGDDAAQKMADAVEKHITPETNEGGVEVSEEKEATTEETVDETVTPDEAVDPDVTEEEKAPAAEEVPTDEPDFEKLIDEITGTVNKALEETKEATSTVVKAVEDKIEKALEFSKNSAAELGEKIQALESHVNELKSDQEKVAKAVDALQKGTAMKKSVDTEDETPAGTEEFGWKGVFSLGNL